ncbi:retrotrans_gag domain-containing protein [Trichonephila clavipes]|uniref:Retrotrans_gag domain-containing protein n=1 Tax=Trichonephila clavipes TaxID=2585209 RepID=A0A8X6V9A0_TRICX|nr:retrotrans_gag domain-containing protein [Trichonephila clavipes]
MVEETYKSKDRSTRTILCQLLKLEPSIEPPEQRETKNRKMCAHSGKKKLSLQEALHLFLNLPFEISDVLTDDFSDEEVPANNSAGIFGLPTNLKEYDRVAKFNKWDDWMCLDNIYFFLDGTGKKGYINSEGNLNSWEMFKIGLSALFADRQITVNTRKADEQLKFRAQRSGEVRSHTYKVSWVCAKKIISSMSDDENC